MPIQDDAPLPKRDTGRIIAARANNECPLRTLDWYRMPELFQLGQSLFGHPWMNQRGQSRQRVDRTLQHRCNVYCQKYPGACDRARQDVCVRLAEQAFDATNMRPLRAAPQPYLVAILRRQINDELAHAEMKTTVRPIAMDIIPMAVNTL